NYPNFASLLEPLLIYFGILGVYAASSGNAAAMLTVFGRCSAYCTHLSTLNHIYLWLAILQYHEQF
ncbi:hypothetical protein B0H34DRAFT_614904, partial [Crassisporium funariophilum]